MVITQRKIMLVEDSKSYQSIFSAAFNNSDHQLTICNSGEEAISRIRNQYIDFVCSSYYLRDMEGVALCKELRSVTRNAYKPFVLLTSVESDDLLKQTLPAGVTDIFHKRDVEQLLAYIKRFPFQGQNSAGRILYVEDSRSQRDMVQSMLQARNLTVDAFASADMAWPQYIAEDYDLVLTDIVLDGRMSGLNFVNLIRRQLGKKGDIPILAITAFDDRTRRLQLFNLGITDYIIKPVIEEELFVRINNLLLKQNAIKLMEHYDVLTHLPNRALFTEKFQQAITDAKNYQRTLAICYLDLDGFKLINDQYGRDIGDKLIVEVANRLRGEIRDHDFVSRLGGDEYALLLSHLTDFEECEVFLNRLLTRISQPYQFGEFTISIAASCGVTLYPNDNADPDTLLRHADHAMCQAKQRGRNSYRLFDTELDQALKLRHRQQSSMNRALNNNEFCLYYQPKINMQTGDVFGMEALIRWNHPSNGLLIPATFLGNIVGSELEVKLGNWVINSALEQLSRWNDLGLQLQVSVNISPKHIQSPAFITQLQNLLATHAKVMANQFEIEVLESSVLENLKSVGDAIKACRDQLGIGIALDDFGTGYSSLSHLRHLPIHTVKIDQSFVRDMIEDANDLTIVEGVIGLARAFKLEVIAEGVESAEHGLRLLDLGCQRAQGYGIARPMPAEMVHDWIKNYRPDPQWLNFRK